MHEKEDYYYIDQTLSGDTEAYRWLVDKYKDHSLRLAFQILKNIEDAEDVVQDSFVKAFGSLKKFKKEAAFSTWLYRIVYNMSIDRTRKKKVQTVDIQQASSVSTEDTGTIDPKGELELLKKAMNELANDESLIIQLHYLEGKDMKEIGHIVGSSHAAVRKKISRVRIKLRNDLEKILGKETLKLS
ncbi:MAG: RNA polymerase sigma factor [Cyclobacteriaceae bacterium]